MARCDGTWERGRKEVGVYFRAGCAVTAEMTRDWKSDQNGRGGCIGAVNIRSLHGTVIGYKKGIVPVQPGF